MGRTRFSGPVAGNYVTLRLLSSEAVGASATTTVYRFAFLQGFRASRVCFDALGQTGVVQARVTKNDGAGLTALTTVSSGVPAAVTTGNLVDAERNVTLGDTFDLEVVTAGGAASPAGSVVAYVTGYFTSHIHEGSLVKRIIGSANTLGSDPYEVANGYPLGRAQPGQTNVVAATSGFYDLFPLINLEDCAVAEETKCSILAPYDGRVMAIFYDLRGHTGTTTQSNVDIGGTQIHTLLDNDANPQFRVDANTSPAFASSTARDFSRGDAITLQALRGAGTTTINELTADVLVWCRGHVRDETLEGQTED